MRRSECERESKAENKLRDYICLPDVASTLQLSETGKKKVLKVKENWC